MTFVTVDSKVSFDEYHLSIKKVKQDANNRYWFDSFILFIAFIGFQTYRAIYDKPMAWVFVIIGITWLYPHLERIFKILFIYQWGNKVKLEKIKTFSILQQENELETTLCLQLNNGRQKLLTFRNAENQIDNFVDALTLKMDKSISTNSKANKEDV